MRCSLLVDWPVYPRLRLMRGSERASNAGGRQPAANAMRGPRGRRWRGFQRMSGDFPCRAWRGLRDGSSNALRSRRSDLPSERGVRAHSLAGRLIVAADRVEEAALGFGAVGRRHGPRPPRFSPLQRIRAGLRLADRLRRAAHKDGFMRRAPYRPDRPGRPAPGDNVRDRSPRLEGRARIEAMNPIPCRQRAGATLRPEARSPR